jgi:AcrR family transcriptional regulator
VGIEKEGTGNPVGRPAGGQKGAPQVNKKEELLETGVALFSERGFQGTSIRDIAKEMGVSLSNLYHYFKNKEGLWLAILEYSIKGLPEKLEKAAESRRDPLESFTCLVFEHLRQTAFHQRESRIFLIDSDQLSEEGKRVNREIQMRILDIYVNCLRSLKEVGLINTDHLKILAFNVLGSINWYMKWYRPDGPMSEEMIHKEVVQFALCGVVGQMPVGASDIQSR